MDVKLEKLAQLLMLLKYHGVAEYSDKTVTLKIGVGEYTSAGTQTLGEVLSEMDAKDKSGKEDEEGGPVDSWEDDYPIRHPDQRKKG